MSQPGQADLPRGWGPPPARGRLRVQPEDFAVREQLGFEPDGEGDHLLLRVRKRGANSLWVAEALARRAGVAPRDVGLAGLKDRDAVTEQSYTLPVRKDVAASDWIGVTGEGFEVLHAVRHRRKLPRGALAGNAFRIVVRDFEAERAAVEARLAQIAAQGVPNYFGPQRFGRDGGNLGLARHWFAGGAAPRGRTQRSFALSAARAAIFNSILAARVADGSWNRLLDGDVANLEGSGSFFAVTHADAELQRRAAALDLHPTGALWGTGELATSASVRALESTVVADWQALAAGLAAQGLRQERRALRLAVHDLAWVLDGTTLELSFRLGRGAFATAVLAEIVVDAGALAERDE